MRYTMMSILAIDDNITIYNPLSIDWTKFKWTNGYIPHKLEKNEILKPYLIAYKYFENVAYENIILLLNGIDDVWELPVNTEIRIPDEAELKKFLLDNRAR